MKISQMLTINNEYPDNLVLFQGKDSFGSVGEDAAALRHVLYCKLSEAQGVFVASHENYEEIVRKLEKKKVSYVVVNKKGHLFKTVDFSDNHYYELTANKIKNLPDDYRMNELFSKERCKDHLGLIKGKEYYGAVNDDSDILKMIVTCHHIDTDSNTGKRYSFGPLDDLEYALMRAHVSYYISENNKIDKIVSYENNQYEKHFSEMIKAQYESEEAYEHIDYPEIEDLTDDEEIKQEQLSDEDLSEITSVRNIYFDPTFQRYYDKARVDIREKINEILDNFRTLEGNQMREYLQKKTNKSLKGTGRNIDKLYVDNSSGHRLLWTWGSDIFLEQDSIVVIAYAEDHDKGQSREGANFDPNAEMRLAFKRSEKLQSEAANDFEEKIPPYLFYKSRCIPQLNKEQRELLDLEPPVMFQGCAGSGKTQVSIELFADLIDKQQEPKYVTFTRELVDEVREKTKELPSLENEVITDRIMTINNFMLDILGEKSGDITVIGGKEFCKWKKTRYISRKDKKYKDVDPEFAWTYIRGVIKGGAADFAVADRQTFKKYMKKENVDESECDLIYDIFEDYEKYRKEKGAVDDNDLARLVCEDETSAATVSTIIADEVQDLTYSQIAALNHCVKDYRIYLCGDINQRINPTIIDLDTIRKLYYQDGRSALQSRHLGSSFRSGRGLISMLNHLSDLRRKYIGRQDRNTEIPETSLRESGEGLWATICDENAMDLQDVCLIANEAANCIVIVPDENVRGKLTNENDQLNERIKTVQEMKGLEYDNVIIYDFLSHNSEKFSEIFKGEGKRDTFGRRLFNMLYVACTRATDRLIICESNCDSGMKELVYKDVTTKDTINSVRGFMQLEEDDEGWLKEAVRLEKMQKFESAIDAYSRIIKSDHTHDIRRCELMNNSNMILEERKNAFTSEERDMLEDSLINNATELLTMNELGCADRLYNYLDDYFNKTNINALFTKVKTGQGVSSEYVQRVIKGTDDETISDNIVAILPYTESRLERNDVVVSDIKKKLEEIESGR